MDNDNLAERVAQALVDAAAARQMKRALEQAAYEGLTVTLTPPGVDAGDFYHRELGGWLVVVTPAGASAKMTARDIAVALGNILDAPLSVSADSRPVEE